ncbi:hypothetical protein [Agromyces bauzanensis]|uniref:Uncharacterized protein n=1 Tax=Agromyces bauzanensis TaxID=1308924 RepID=A0A917PDC8_9MICO|nr:hypothetical protein [Agromyces bauzanensis]GGJ71729.1 hypothetical protein GCM10011372_07080 [Agromyces bauzanensis]
MRPSDASVPPAARRRTGNILAATALAGMLAFGLGAHQFVATTAHAAAWPAWTAADGRFDEARAAYEETTDRGDSAIARAEYLLGIATGDLVRPEDREALAERIESARGILAESPTGPTGIVELGDPATPAPAWERYADLWRLVDLVPSRDAAAERFEAAADRVEVGTRTIAEASDALLSGTEELATAALDASPSAAYRYRHAAEEALDGLRHSPGISSGDADRFTALATALADVRASHAAEEERRSAYPVRAEIEAFARSIAAGVELEFAWAYEVAGLPSDGWYSGTAEFKPDGVGWGLISLTESIEWEWYADENARAVVVHEVGHTQVLRDACYAIFAAEPFHGDHETWATAWAIGMGHDLPGAGIEAYGRPSDAQIAAASGCR